MDKSQFDKIMIEGLKRRLKISLSLLSKEQLTEYQLRISKSTQ
jgi:hypothetical protein